MTVEDIIRYTARNLELLSSDNKTILSGKITREGLLDEFNRLYTGILTTYLGGKLPDQFTVEARRPLYRTALTVSAYDAVTKTLTASTGVLGNADVGAYLYSPDLKLYVKIDDYVLPNQVRGSFSSNWIGRTVYVLSDIILLDGDIANYAELTKVQVKYGLNSEWRECEYTTNSNYRDQIDLYTVNTRYKPFYTIGQIEINGVMQRVLRVWPRATDIDGEIKISYVKPLDSLSYEDTPQFINSGIADVIINALTAWGFRLMGAYDKAQVYEENNPALGGVIPKGMTFFNRNVRQQRDKPVTFKNPLNYR